jgi:hypothetical protein
MSFFKVNTKLIEVVFPKIIWHTKIKIFKISICKPARLSGKQNNIYDLGKKLEMDIWQTFKKLNNS